jgi:hypothetical protein
VVGLCAIRFYTWGGHTVAETVAFYEELAFVLTLGVGAAFLFDDGSGAVWVALDDDVGDKCLYLLDAFEEFFVVACCLCRTFLGRVGVGDFDANYG